jgi:amidohydrolase
MPVINRIADLQDDAVEWRHDYHGHPELLYEVKRTAADVAKKLRAFGCDEVAEGIGRIGVVGVLRGSGGGSGPVIGLRADMDALPIVEESGKPWASTVPGKMHACGHDGHTTMLLTGARYLAETRRFRGTAIFIFQPAEEGGAGARAMVEDGLMERFGIEEVYGLHNFPGMPVGNFGIRPGLMMASSDQFTLEIEGRGAHAARPHESIDVIAASTAIVQAFQSIVARNVDPLASAVVSVTTIHAGDTAFNVLPPRATITGTARALDPVVRDLLERRLGEIALGVADGYGAKTNFHYLRNYPMVSNHAEQTKKAIAVASGVAGAANVDTDVTPIMGGEDFSFMLHARPGAFIFMGNGDTAGLHHPAYDFSDEAIPYGASYWAMLVESLMPVHPT